MLFRHGFNDTTNAFKAYRREVIETVQPLLSNHFNLTVELPLKAIVRGHSFAVIPISWRNRTAGTSKLAIQEMGSRYLFIVLYVFLEHHLSRGDYRRGRDSGVAELERAARAASSQGPKSRRRGARARPPRPPRARRARPGTTPSRSGAARASAIAPPRHDRRRPGLQLNDRRALWPAAPDGASTGRARSVGGGDHLVGRRHPLRGRSKLIRRVRRRAETSTADRYGPRRSA